MEEHMENNLVSGKLDHRTQYVEKCKKEVAELLKDNKIIISYIKNHKNQRIGVLVATKPLDSPTPLIGWSLCKISAEPFNKYIGLVKAIKRIEDGCPMVDEETPFLPNTVERVLPKFEERVKRYFKEA
jgi:hypothetical protein